MRILVTGASGFVGGAACPELTARGHDVFSLVRRPGSEPPGTEPVVGDLIDEQRLRAAVAAVAPECVVHLAAETATQRDGRRIEAVNVDGTRRLLAGCAASGVQRFVFVSTVVTGDAKGALLDEGTPLPVQTVYGRSKQRGERLVREAPLEGVILRPSHIYGAGGWYAKDLVARLRAPGRFAVVGKGDNCWDLVRVDDLAHALCAAAERAPAGALYHVVDDQPMTYYEFASLTARGLGVGPPRRVPVTLARLVAGTDPVRAAVRSARSSNARIKAELGWQPKFPTAEAGVPGVLTRLAGGPG